MGFWGRTIGSLRKLSVAAMLFLVQYVLVLGQREREGPRFPEVGRR